MISITTILTQCKTQFNLNNDKHIFKSIKLIFLDNDNAHASLKEDFLHLCKIRDGDNTSIM